MKTSQFVCVLALSSALLVFAPALVRGEEGGEVVDLGVDDFDQFVADQKLALIMFYAPWCGHCKAMKPEYEEAAKEMAGKDVGVLAKVDCTVHREVCDKFEVRGFPTVKLFAADAEPVDYDQARKADAIVKFMTKQSQPPVTELEGADAVAEFAKDESVKVVAFVDGQDLAAYTKVAQALRNEYSFAAVTGAADLAKENGASVPGVVVFRDFDEGNVAFSGDFAAETFGDELTSFIKAQSFPVVGEIGPENYMKYLERGFNFVWIFLNPEDETEQALVENAIKPVAAEFRDQLSFVTLDGVRWAEHAKSFGLPGTTPGVVLEDREKSKNFIFPADTDITQESFRAHIAGVLDGSVAATIKSEPIPEENDGPVAVIVGKTFDDIVLDDSKDVFVEFYAPWCGHCKALTPKFEELGNMFADDENVIIAKIDATANDSPAQIQGFPTLIFYPAGDKSNPVEYNGDRSTEDMATFVRKTATTLEGDAADEAADAGADATEDAAAHEDL